METTTPLEDICVVCGLDVACFGLYEKVWYHKSSGEPLGFLRMPHYAAPDPERRLMILEAERGEH